MKKLCKRNKEPGSIYSNKLLLTMKLSSILLVFGFLQVSAAGLSQGNKVNLSMDSVSFEEFVAAVEQQSDYRFVYLNKTIEDILITAKGKNASTTKLISSSLTEAGLNYEITDSKLVIITPENATGGLQPRTITGTVTDENGESLPGVSILIKGTTRGSVTNLDGEYSIEVDGPEAVLVFSFVGMLTQEILVEDQTAINITLSQDVLGLEEVVVVGYGTRAKGRLTGAVSNLTGEVIDQSPEMNILRSIQGKIPGLKIMDRGGEPGQNDIEMTIRGKSTFGNNSPLIVIDGIPRSSFFDIPPQDIKSISVLKDASAAIYGARAANGVILIETKRGEKGASLITFNSSFGWSKYTRTPKLQNSYQNSVFSNEADARYNRVLRWSADDLQKFQSGSDPITHPDTDWEAESLKNWAPQNHQNISVSGGTDRVQYYLSGDYLHEGTIYKTDDMYYNRYQLRSNVDVQVSKNLKVGFDLTGRIRDVHHPVLSAPSIFHRIQLAKPMETSVYPNGLLGYGPGGFNPAVGVTDKAGYGDVNGKEFRSKLSFDLNMDRITEGLSLKGYASFDFDMNNSAEFINTWDCYIYNVETGEYDVFIGKPYENQTYTSLEKYSSYYQSIF